MLSRFIPVRALLASLTSILAVIGLIELYLLIYPLCLPTPSLRPGHVQLARDVYRYEGSILWAGRLVQQQVPHNEMPENISITGRKIQGYRTEDKLVINQATPLVLKNTTAKKLDFSFQKETFRNPVVIDRERLALLKTINVTEALDDAIGNEGMNALKQRQPDIRFDFPDVKLPGPDVCNGSAPFLLVMVLSQPNSRLSRQVIRQTWGSAVKGQAWPHFGQLSAQVQLMFIVGHTNSSPSLDSNVLEEQALYKDLLILNTTEGYTFLTDKTLGALRWIKECCPGVQFVLKADEDSFINMPLLVDFLFSRQQEFSNSILGRLYHRPVVYRWGKWKVPYRSYPFKRFPDYASGSSYVIAGDALPTLLDAVSFTAPIPIEDAYVTGILAKIAGVKRLNTSALAQYGDMLHYPTLCQFLQERLAITDLRVTIIDGMWQAVELNYCEMNSSFGLDPLPKRYEKVKKSKKT